MPRDTSLDEFLDADDAEEADRSDPDGRECDPSRSDDRGDGSSDPDDRGDDPSEPDPDAGPESTEDAIDDRGPGSSEERPASDEGPESEDRPDSETHPDPGSVAPARATYEWRPAGAECADCGVSVTRRWRAGEAGDDDRMVCGDCKDW